MNDILINIISVLITAVVLPLISLIGKKLVDLLNSKINDNKLETNLSKATTIVVNAVQTVLQTYVDTLKKNGKFDGEAQMVALQKAKEIALNQMDSDIKQFISKNFGDMDTWLVTQIESTIHLLKSKN